MEFKIKRGRKNIEASAVNTAGAAAEIPIKRRPNQPKQRDHDTNTKIQACMQAAIAIAGADKEHLCRIIPMLLRHNNLPVISIPPEAAYPKQKTWQRKTTEMTPKEQREEEPEEEEQQEDHEDEHSIDLEDEESDHQQPQEQENNEQQEDEQQQEEPCPRHPPGTPLTVAKYVD